MIPCFLIISVGDRVICAGALIDSGPSGFAFVDEAFVRHHSLPMFALRQPRIPEAIDGRPISSGDTYHLAKAAKLATGNHQEQFPMFVTKLGHYPLVLGFPWLRHHNALTRYRSNPVTPDFLLCLKHYNAVVALFVTERSRTVGTQVLDAITWHRRRVGRQCRLAGAGCWAAGRHGVGGRVAVPGSAAPWCGRSGCRHAAAREGYGCRRAWRARQGGRADGQTGAQER